MPVVGGNASTVASAAKRAILAAVAVASTVTRRDAVDVILTVMDGVPPRGIGPSARISVVALLFLGCNVTHVSGLGMRLPAVTCW